MKLNYNLSHLLLKLIIEVPLPVNYLGYLNYLLILPLELPRFPESLHSFLIFQLILFQLFFAFLKVVQLQ